MQLTTDAMDRTPNGALLPALRVALVVLLLRAMLTPFTCEPVEEEVVVVDEVDGTQPAKGEVVVVVEGVGVLVVTVVVEVVMAGRLVQLPLLTAQVLQVHDTPLAQHAVRHTPLLHQPSPPQRSPAAAAAMRAQNDTCGPDDQGGNEVGAAHCPPAWAMVAYVIEIHAPLFPLKMTRHEMAIPLLATLRPAPPGWASTHCADGGCRVAAPDTRTEVWPP